MRKLFLKNNLLAFGAVFIFLALPPSVHVLAETIISENFEVPLGDLGNGSPAEKGLVTKGWSYWGNCNGYCTGAIVPAPTGRTGNVLRYRYEGLFADDSHNAQLGNGFAPPQPEIYVRYYVRYEPAPGATQSDFGGGAAITAKQHYWKVGNTSPDGYPNFVLNHMFGSREVVIGPQGAKDHGSVVSYANKANIPLVDNRWYCTEYHWKMNTPDSSDGVEEIWINGVQTLGVYNRKFRDAAHANAAFTYVNIYRQGASNMYRYEDDFIVSTTRIGCEGVLDTTAPAAPTSLKAAAKSSSQIDLSWTDNASDESGYKIERKVSSTGSWSLAATVPANQTTYTYVGSASHTFYFRVSALKANGTTSGYSNTDSATTSAANIWGAGSGVRGQKVNSHQFTVNSRNGEVKFALPEAREYQLSVYDLAGRNVWDLERRPTRASVQIGAPIQNVKMGAELKDGMYIAILKQADKRVSKTFCVIK